MQEGKAVLARGTKVALSDRFGKRQGRILISGVQALVRLTILQAERDKAAGLRTAGFVSGYRGSPLGTLDAAFERAGKLPQENGIVVKPAVNEDMAATAVAGSQQLERSPGAKVDGVFALWYGKGPGLDRAADAIRHGNYQGASPHGGVVLAVGDDHIAKSSSIICYSDETVASLQVPLLCPSDPNEIVVYGLHGFAMSRLTGSWVALKIPTDLADGTRTVPADERDTPIILPEIESPAMGLHNRWPETPGEQEIRQQNYRLPAIQAYMRANALDRVVLRADGARIGIIAAGKSWLDLREALLLLGLDEAALMRLGVALYKPAMIWPLEPQRLGEFTRGLEELIIVEEKAPLIESQVKAILYGRPGAPGVSGKTRADGTTLFPKTGDLTPELIAAGIGAVLARVSADKTLDAALGDVLGDLETLGAFALPPIARKPFFCSGCPHNRSTTNLPEGSRALAGIGCHGLAAYNQPGTGTFAQMGGEGVHWMGLSPFTDEPHVFVNMGDGTYFHSGLLAIRQAVAAKLNVTYKLLYNDAVAMTGGQRVDGELSVARLIDQVRAEGVGTIVVCTDDPARYPARSEVRAGADRIEHRDALGRVQAELRATPGVSVIVYEQICATEKRRLRKRGRLPEPDMRVMINDRVCEDCGDCSAVSNCLSIEPVDTEFGTGRRINQSSCNTDYSCLNGFCPSFVTVSGGKIRKPDIADALHDTQLPLPATDAAAMERQRVLVAGIGGTGVITTAALLSMAAHVAGHETAVLDQVGMAQKGGAVTSHVHISGSGAPINALRIPVRKADIVIACDEIVGNARDVIAAVDPAHTCVVANADVAISGEFTRNRNARPDAGLLTRRLAGRTGEGRFAAYPFTRLAEGLFGDAIASNMMMIGFACQKGWLPLDMAALGSAIELNGTGAKRNLRAFGWGRQLALNPRAVFKAAGLAEKRPETRDERIGRRAAFLGAYQDQAYADRYLERIQRLRDAEARISASCEVTDAAAQALFRLMACKDEYEVARLYTDGVFAGALSQQFEGPVRLTFHLAPPVLSGRDRQTGHLKKRKFGPWIIPVFRMLARLRGLRGTWLDPFGYTEERRTERALIPEFEAVLDSIAERLTAQNLALAAELAALPSEIRGYGHVKARAIAAYRASLAEKLGDFQDGTPASAGPALPEAKGARYASGRG